MTSRYTLELIQAKLADLNELKQLIFESIECVASKDYSKAQREVWQRGACNEERLKQVINEQWTRVAVLNSEIIGFATLAKNGYIDLFYVHKDFQRKGVAKELLGAIELKAIDDDEPELTGDISLTARSFFRNNGFTLVKEQLIERDGVSLTNYKMRKQLVAS